MERIFDSEVIFKTILPAVVIAALAVGLAVVAFGTESLASGVHEAFHDFRHVIGMPCH
jgi:cobalt transporter subunit CbtB